MRIMRLAVMLCALAALGAKPKADVPGSADHPVLTRFPGTLITWYQQVEYDEFVLPLGKAQGKGQFERSEKVAGKVTRTVYVSEEVNHSVLEIFESYVQALTTAGFEVLYRCTNARECGLRMAEYMGSSWNTDNRYLAAKGGDPAAPTYVALFVETPGAAPRRNIVQRVIETRPMKAGQVTANAAAISQGLAAQGKFALYGLYFDTGKAELDPKSEPALAEVAEVLKGNPKLELYVVGHTDLVGQEASNVDLSERRAAATVKALVDRHGIAARRLSAKGMGPFAPVGSNRSEEGRAKNRRVELVERRLD